MNQENLTLFPYCYGDFPELTNEDIQACLAFAADREHKLQYAQ